MTTKLPQLGETIRSRRTELGLSQALFAGMCRVTVQTIDRFENDNATDADLGHLRKVRNLLGLGPEGPVTLHREPKRAVWMAARSASTSYKTEIPESELTRALATGEVPQAFVAHLGTLLEEAPWELLVMAVEEAALRERVAPDSVWRNIALISERLDLVRCRVFQ